MGFQSIILHEGNYLVDTTMLQYGEVTVPADFVGLNEVSVWGPFGKHGPRGNRYCLLPGGICWHRLGVDDLGETDFGMGAASIISNPAGTGLEIHFRFFNDAQPINGHIPVDSNTLLNNQISNALGFKEVLLRGGNYPVDYSNYQYGEISVPVAVVNYGETAAGSPFGRHKCTWEAHYCLCRGGICWKDIFHLSEETVLLNEYGWYAMSEFTNTVGAGSSIKLRFLNDPQPDSLGYLSVDSVKLNQDLSNELGYGGVTLLGGDYFVDYSNYQYGEITVGAYTGWTGQNT
ncbi:MAG: hypothetical protein IPL53_08200 [Ignavibacteria bacterium]|nr:hypothetical protein [Ignavibacteria bacterium]